MEDFKREYAELVKWFQGELKKAEELPLAGEGLDGASEQARYEIEAGKEYRQKLLALKKKYETESVEPVTKARTFNQVLQPTGT